ncbi:hypothetical protein BO70DRAFT_287361, partial [Aspergillus heteromorphus CBS 117.55]
LELRNKCVEPDTGRAYMKGLKAGAFRRWEPYNRGMTHGFVLEFENQADLDYYLTEDPVHLEFSKNAAPLMYATAIFLLTVAKLTEIGFLRQ